MVKKFLTLLFLCSGVYLLSCALGVKLQFQQPANISLAGVKRLAIAPCTGLREAPALEKNLIAKLDSINFYYLFDKTKLDDSLRQRQLTYQQIFESDSSSLIDIGNSINLDAMLFTDLKKLAIDFEAVGSENIERTVWTGDYERNEFGDIIEEESPTGEKVKKKKMKVKILEQQFQIRKASIEVFFRLIDFQMGTIYRNWNIVENYVDNTLIGKDTENLPTEKEIKDILISRAVKSLMNEIAPINRIVKRSIAVSDANIDSGAVYAQQSQWDKAIAYWKQAEENNQNEARLFYNLGLAYEAQGNYKMAEVNYVKASLLDLKNKIYARALENIQKIWIEKSERKS